MDIQEYQRFISAFYKNVTGINMIRLFVPTFNRRSRRSLSGHSTIEIGRDRPDETVLADEENLENLTEELGDVLDNLFILADKYDISLEMIMQKHRTKLMERYPEE